MEGAAKDRDQHHNKRSNARLYSLHAVPALFHTCTPASPKLLAHPLIAPFQIGASRGAGAGHLALGGQSAARADSGCSSCHGRM